MHNEASRVEELAATYEVAVNSYVTERNKPMPNRIHGVIQSALSFLLIRDYSNDYQLVSELSLDSVPPATPDLCIYPTKKLDIKTIQAKEQEAPLTTIEIISPSQTLNELMHKAWDIYFPMDVKSAWIVVPELKCIHVVLPNDENLVFGSGMLNDPATGIRISVDKVFEQLL
jgi:Uma2 family endonuclease